MKKGITTHYLKRNFCGAEIQSQSSQGKLFVSLFFKFNIPAVKAKPGTQFGVSVRVCYLNKVHLQYSELPRPDLGDVESLKDLMRSTKSSPTTVSCTFEQINNFDSIEVSQLPEKKGIFLKHIEYEVTSKVCFMF